MIWWTGLAPWEFEFPFPGSYTSTFLERRVFTRAVVSRSRAGRNPEHPPGKSGERHWHARRPPHARKHRVRAIHAGSNPDAHHPLHCDTHTLTHSTHSTLIHAYTQHSQTHTLNTQTRTRGGVGVWVGGKLRQSCTCRCVSVYLGEAIRLFSAVKLSNLYWKFNMSTLEWAEGACGGGWRVTLGCCLIAARL